MTDFHFYPISSLLYVQCSCSAIKNNAREWDGMFKRSYLLQPEHKEKEFETNDLTNDGSQLMDTRLKLMALQDWKHLQHTSPPEVDEKDANLQPRDDWSFPRETVCLFLFDAGATHECNSDLFLLSGHLTLSLHVAMFSLPDHAPCNLFVVFRADMSATNVGLFWSEGNDTGWNSDGTPEMASLLGASNDMYL